MTAELRYPDQPLALTPDGRMPFGTLDCPGGCADLGCADTVGFLCSFIDLLPCGPMWDRPKTLAREQIQEAGGIPPDGLTCGSMASLAVLIGQFTAENVREILGAAYREANPCTAVTTVSDWLDRFGWEDCYRTACNTEFLKQLSPYTLEDECGDLTFVPTDFPADFEAALQHAILKSLVRLQLGVIKNLDGINYVIEPLGAQLVPAPYPAEVQDFLDNGTIPAGTPDGCPPCFRDYVSYELVSLSDTLPGAPTVESFCGDDPAPVDAVQSYDNGTGAVDLFPGCIAAECFIRSMMPEVCPNLIIRKETGPADVNCATSTISLDPVQFRADGVPTLELEIKTPDWCIKRS